ncbi:MAG: hypothetical protein AVDCRST_MAG49-3676, partial [uncultured Thermomicrobiales bacterium]
WWYRERRDGRPAPGKPRAQRLSGSAAQRRSRTKPAATPPSGAFAFSGIRN